MTLLARFVRAPGPVVAGLVATIFLGADAQERRSKLRICTHSSTGAESDPLDLARLEKSYRSVASETAQAFRAYDAQIRKIRVGAFRSGLPAASAAAARTVTLDPPVPPDVRKRTLYFVTALSKGERPKILPEKRELEKGTEVFVIEARSLEDVAALATTLGRRVTLASAAFARAVGVRARDARVTFSADGKTATVREEAP